MSRDLLVFGEDWGAHPSSTQHLVRQLASDRKVVWVNSLGLRRPRLNPRDLRRLASKASRLLGRPAARTATPFPIIEPLAVPWPGNPLARSVNRRLVGRQIRQALARVDVRAPVIWASLPNAVDLADDVGASALIYYAGDDFSALAGVDHAAVATLESEIAGQADIILAASPVIAARFPAHKTVHLPHGCDVALFSAPTSRPVDLPEGRILGFAGTLASWIDMELIAEAARRRSDWHIVLIGPEAVDLSALSALPNVRRLGSRPHHMLPAYLQHFDIGLLPYRDCAQIRACNPLKLREYLAAGIRIAATDFPGLDGYRDLVDVVRDPQDLADLMGRHGNWSDTDAAVQRRRVASESWAARADDVRRLVDHP